MSDELTLCPYIINLNYGEMSAGQTAYERMCLWYEIELITQADAPEGGVITYDQFLPAKPGRIYIRRPGMIVHGIAPYSYRAVVFDSVYDETFSDLYGRTNFLDGSFDYPYLKRMLDRGHMCSLLDDMPPCVDTDDYARYFECYDELLRLHIEKPPFCQLRMRTAVMRIIVYLQEDIRRQSAQNVFDRQTRDLVYAMRDYLYENYPSRLTLEVLSQTFSVSREYICRLFKRYLGVSPMEYLNSVRLFYAKEQLLLTDRTVEQIAAACGFSSVQYFYALYKRTYGATPKGP